MKFMLMMHAPRGDGDWGIGQWSSEALNTHIAYMHELNKNLQSEGALVAAEGLAMPGQARIVRSGKQGKPEVTDGPFAESKEFLAGYWIVDVDSPDAAYRIAAKASSAPGPDGKPLHMAIEVREVMTCAPVEA